MRIPGVPFTARFPGKCRGCGELYEPRSVIVSPGKGGGAFHKRCWDSHTLVTRKLTPEDLQRLRELKNKRRVARSTGGS